MFNTQKGFGYAYLLMIIAALMTAVLWQNGIITQKKIASAQLQLQLEAAQKEIEARDQVLASFDRSFKEVQAAVESRQAVVLEALKQVEKLSTKNVALSNKLLGSVPQSADVCTEANALINLYLNEIKTETR